MAKTTFVNGMNLEAEFLNAINNPQFVEVADNDGEIPLITNNDLSNAAGQIKPEWVAFRDELKVSASTGLSVTYTGGIVILPNSNQQTIAPGTLALPNNATSTIYVDTAGAIASSTTPPVLRLDLARVTTAAGVISGAIVDLRPRFRVLPRINAIKVFGGFGDQSDFNLASGSATFDQGEYYYRNFTVASSATLTISFGARIFVSGDCTINGTINVTTATRGGIGRALGSPGYYPSVPGNGLGAGVITLGGSAYQYFVSFIGSSGSSGELNVLTSSTGSGGNAGDGGGGVIFEVAGAFLLATGGSIVARGGNATASTWASGTGAVGGGGGGSGGGVIVRSLTSITLQAGSTIDVRGGNAGGGLFAGTASAVGGGGGGGGVVALLSPSNSNSGSILLTGGTGGAAANNGGTTVAGGGGGGFGGAGGAQGNPGTIGILITRNFAPVG